MFSYTIAYPIYIELSSSKYIYFFRIFIFLVILIIIYNISFSPLKLNSSVMMLVIFRSRWQKIIIYYLLFIIYYLLLMTHIYIYIYFLVLAPPIHSTWVKVKLQSLGVIRFSAVVVCSKDLLTRCPFCESWWDGFVQLLEKNSCKEFQRRMEGEVVS